MSREKGFKHSEETKQKIRQANLGNKPWSKGLTKHTSSSLMRLSIANQKVIHTKEWNEKVSRALKGKSLSPEHKEKLSQAHIGKMLGKSNPAYKHGLSHTKEMWAYYEIQREARKLKNGGSYTFSQWQKLKEKYNHTCLCCKKKEPSISLVPDHITPISKGGVSDIWNIQPLCRSCNSKKYNKTINYAR